MASSPLACSRAAWNGRGSISKRTWPFSDQRAFLVVLPDEIPLDLGVDLGVHQAVGGAHPFPDDGDVLLYHVHHFYHRVRPGGQLFSPRSPSAARRIHGDCQKKNCHWISVIVGQIHGRRPHLFQIIKNSGFFLPMHYFQRHQTGQGDGQVEPVKELRTWPAGRRHLVDRHDIAVPGSSKSDETEIS